MSWKHLVTSGDRDGGGAGLRSRPRRWKWVVLAVAVLLAIGTGAAVASHEWQRIQAELGFGYLAVPAPDMSEIEAESGMASVVENERQRTQRHLRSSDAWLRYGNVLDAANMQDFAVLAYREAARLDPDDIRPRYHLAIMLHGMGEFGESIALLEDLTEQDPDYPPFFLRLGDVLASAGRFEEASQAYRSAIEISPDYPVARSGLGRALLALGEHEAAVTELEQAVDLVSGEADRATFAALAQAYRLIGRAEDADRMARLTEDAKDSMSARDSLRLPVVRFRPDIRNAKTRAELLLESGKYEEAALAIELLAGAWPQDPWHHVALADVYAMLGRNEDAELHRQRAEQLYLAGQYGDSGNRVRFSLRR